MHESLQTKTGRFALREHLTALAVLAAANIVLFRDYWLGEKVFSGKDFLTAFYPLLNFQTDCLQGGSWPLWNPFMNFGYPYVEHYVNSAFFPTHLLMGLVTGSSLFLIQRELLFWIIVGGFGIYLCVRELGLRTTTGIISGLSFMGCGQIIALPQWSMIVYNAACFPYILLGYHRAKRFGRAFNTLSILFLAFTIYGGYIVTTVLGIYLFAAYVLIDAFRSRNMRFGFRYLGITVTATVALTLPKLLPLYGSMGAGPRLSYAPGSGPFDTFNIIEPYNFLSLLLPVKYYFSLFLGTAGILALINGSLRMSLRPSSLAIMTILSGWLLMSGSDGSPSLLRDAASFLPFMRLVRNDWLSWFFPSIFAILFLARQIEAFFVESDRRSRYITGGIYALLLTLTFLWAFNTELYFGAFFVHGAVAAALLYAPDMRIPSFPPGSVAAALLFVELVTVLHRVDVNVPPVRQEDRLLLTIADQGSVSRSYRDDNHIRSAFRAVAVDDRLRPTIDQARQHPILHSGLHGMPAVNYAQEQYGMFIDDMNLKRFSGWWYNTQERYEFIDLKDKQLLPRMEGMPLFALLDLQSQQLTETHVAWEHLSCSSFDFRVTAQFPSALLLHQMYDRRWTVEVNGDQVSPELVNGHFMGIRLEHGSHAVTFRFRDRTFTAALAISGIALLLLLAWTIRLALRHQHNTPEVPRS